MLTLFKYALTWGSIGFLWLILSPANAQENRHRGTFDVGGDIVNRFYWRGVNLSESPAIQPYIEYGKGAFTIGAWGSYSFSKEPYQEVDIYACFQKANVCLTFNDYFCPSDSIGVSHKYFNWSNSSTTHAVEAILEVSHIYKSPLSFKGGVFLYGDDKNEVGENCYSTYLEMQCDFQLGEQPLIALIGCAPFEGAYSDRLALVNIGVSAEKDLHFTETVEVPLSIMFAVNPQSESVFMVAGISF